MRTVPPTASSAAFRDPSRLVIQDGRVVTAREMGQQPFVPPRESIKQSYIICLEDGRQLKMLKRHLRAAYGMTLSSTRRSGSCPRIIPWWPPEYSEQKSVYAKDIGLGTATARPQTAAMAD